MRYAIHGFIVGVMLVIIGFVFVFMLDAKVTLTCVRGSNVGDKCTLLSVGKFYSTSQEIKLSDITGAIYVSHTDVLSRLGRRSGRTQYRVEIETRNGRIPLTAGASSWNEARRTKANQITSFVRGSSKSSLKIEDRDDGAGAMVGMIMVVAGILVGRHSLSSSDD